MRWGNQCSWEQSPLLHACPDKRQPPQCSGLIKETNSSADGSLWRNSPVSTQVPCTAARKESFHCLLSSGLFYGGKWQHPLQQELYMGWGCSAACQSPAQPQGPAALQPQVIAHHRYIGWRGSAAALACVHPNCALPPSQHAVEALTQRSRQPGIWGLCTVLQWLSLLCDTQHMGAYGSMSGLFVCFRFFVSFYFGLLSQII